MPKMMRNIVYHAWAPPLVHRNGSPWSRHGMVRRKVEKLFPLEQLLLQRVISYSSLRALPD